MISLQDLIAQKDALERQIETTRKQDRSEAVAKVRSLMSEYGLSAADLSVKSIAKTGPTKGNKVAAKYHDKVTGDSWSGRGLKPNWLKAALASGRKIEEFQV
jgi:DNA-binding protein H-NS